MTGCYGGDNAQAPPDCPTNLSRDWIYPSTFLLWRRSHPFWLASRKKQQRLGVEKL
jgi:hypothetical protein